MTRGANTDLPDMQNGEMDPISLKFHDKTLEGEFQRAVVIQALDSTRIYMWMGLATYVGFGLLDWMLLGSQSLIVFEIRMAASLGMGLCVWIGLSKYAQFYIQQILFAAILFGASGLIVILAILKPPYNYVYYAGIILVIIWCTNLVVFRFYLSAIMATGIVVAYICVVKFLNPIPNWVLTGNLFFLVSTMCWTIWTSYWQETYTRRAFASKYLLQIEKNKTDDLLAAARAGNRAKSEFLAVMSHELRTPLNAIIGFSEIIQKQLYGPIGSDKYAAYIDDIFDSGNHLLRVINDILDLSKAEAGKLEINEDEVDIGDLAQQSLRMFREKADSAGLRLVFVPPAQRPVLWADARLLRQVMINLISNAVKFTLPGGQIAIEIEVTPEGGCTLAVKDTGIGLKADDIPRVLEPFVQVESALSRKNGGTGLGLPLVKRIIERHDGVFELTSVLGKGTSALARFPSRRVMGIALAQPGNLQQVAGSKG